MNRHGKEDSDNFGGQVGQGDREQCHTCGGSGSVEVKKSRSYFSWGGKGGKGADGAQDGQNGGWFRGGRGGNGADRSQDGRDGSKY
ncbi:mesenchyme-specific cell surface glycoprotein [Folsomia candida]|uniref:mesenchyme-specific cell surface glycoprotein n=1 Tax=Folsomia candida TaxID=158441 RepID=UPI000B906396|nr:mesenchyme-specific cell surface glycoprotein [Folsomia candida]